MINAVIDVPGSKSITNRALLLASMAKGKSVLKNVLFSDDSRHLLGCLKALGFKVEIDEENKSVVVDGERKVSEETIEVNVGSAGTTARFLTAMLAHFDGEFIVNASEQMKARPMKPLLDVLIGFGVKITYLEKDGHLPVKLIGSKLSGGSIELPAEQSSQFLSALLLSGNLFEQPLYIKPFGSRKSLPYVEITAKMIRDFGGDVLIDGEGVYTAKHCDYKANEYSIEPDVSSACYFYAMAAIMGGKITVRGVHLSSMQGDIKFLDVLKKLGCSVEDNDVGVTVSRDESMGKYSGIEVDMNAFSDQTMTMAALAIFADSPTHIMNIDHLQFQESNRIEATMTELNRMGICCERKKEGIMIYPGEPKPAEIHTYDDHRMAMAFSLVGLKATGITILNPECTAKTFENYFEIFQKLTNK